MTRSTEVLVTATIVVLVVGFVTVQVVDPFRSQPNEPTRVDLDGDPNEIARDALRVLRVVDHTQNITKTYVSDSTNQTVVDTRAVYRYQPSRRRYSTKRSYDGPLPDDPEVALYGSAHTAWVRSAITRSGWREAHYLRYERVAPFAPSALENATVRIESENETTLVLYVEASTAASKAMDHTIVYHPNTTDELWLVIDKESRRLDKIVNEPAGPRGNEDNVRTTFVIEDYGTTTVDRPEDVPAVSVRAVLWDVLNGPVFELRNHFLHFPF